MLENVMRDGTMFVVSRNRSCANRAESICASSRNRHAVEELASSTTAPFLRFASAANASTSGVRSGKFGMEGSIVATVVMAAVLVLGMFYYNRKETKQNIAR